MRSKAPTKSFSYFNKIDYLNCPYRIVPVTCLDDKSFITHYKTVVIGTGLLYKASMIRDAEKIKTGIARKLRAWYKREQRPLPWRETSDPYRIWISEIMLQQTQVDTVIPYYLRFLEAFSTVEALAGAPLQDVLKAWENLGYYSRARNLHAAAAIIVDKCNGQIPATREGLKSLPGIGDYTAGAILSMAYGQAVPAVDGNVRRILSRLFAVQEPIDLPQTQEQLHQLAIILTPSKNPGDFNQALMDLGATICKAKNPGCDTCPINAHCHAKASGLQDVLPVTRKRPTIPHRQATAALLRDRDDRILVVQRPEEGLLGSLWKLPGGFVQGSESVEVSLRQSVKEELGIQIRVGAHLASVNHAYTHFRISLHAYGGHLLKGTPKALTCQGWRWATADELLQMPLSKIDRMIIQAIFLMKE